jgi:hypothetical protein
MKNLSNIVSVLLLGLIMMSAGISKAQQIDINSGYGNYEPAQFPGYGDHPDAKGIFYSSAGKTSGTIPAYTAQLTIVLAPQVSWSGESFVIPQGWEMDPASTPTNLTFYNSSDWTTEDPYFEIPVMATAARASTAQSVGTQVFNIGGDWIDDGVFNNTTSAVTVIDKPLPVILVSFSATKESGTALLNWSTTFETNSDHFEVQRSMNGKDWNKIGVVTSHGESTSLRNYSFSDSKPTGGENLYRLKIVDKDATFAYSRIQSISFERLDQELSIYPNPTSDYISVRDYNKVKNISVTDTFGNEVSSVNNASPVTVSTGQINVKSLSTGIYLVKITHLNGALSTHKLLINR